VEVHGEYTQQGLMCNYHVFKERRIAFTSEVATILALKRMRDVPVLHVQTGDGKRLKCMYGST
jgi:hypothetical protein